MDNVHMFVQMNDVPIPTTTTIPLYFIKNQELNYLHSFAILLKNAFLLCCLFVSNMIIF
jgi:hypothetical protein